MPSTAIDYKVTQHNFVCDLKSCAVFEFEKKKLVIHQNLPVKALANDFYIESIRTWESGDQKLLAFNMETTVAGPINNLLAPLSDEINATLIEKAHPLLVSKKLKAALKGFPKTLHCVL